MSRIGKLIDAAANSSSTASSAHRFRRARYERFEQLTESVRRGRREPLRVIDLGGTAEYWNLMGGADDVGLEITALNLDVPDTPDPNVKEIRGSATDTGLPDLSFDITFSNSVIEHVGEYEDQLRMAGEVRRLAPTYYLQTPCRSFPIEPHHRALLAHPYLPYPVRRWAMQRRRGIAAEEAEAILNSVRLMTRRELVRAFPDGTVERERLKVFGVPTLTKSWVLVRAIR
jgi:hypothetical protein